MAFERTIEHWRALPQLTVKEAAAVLGVGPDSVRALLKQNELEGRHVCGKTFVIVASIRRFVDEDVEHIEPAGSRPLTQDERRTVRNIREGVASCT